MPTTEPCWASNRMTERRLAGIVALLALCAASCASTPASLARPTVPESCQRPRLGPDSPYRLFLAGAVEDPADQAALARVPAEVRRVMLAAGIEPQVAALLRMRAASQAPTVELLSLQQDLTAHLGALDAQLASLMFEIDCTDDAHEELLHTIEDRTRARELKLTIASLVAGALGGVAAGVWDASDEASKGPAVVGATTAGVAAALGIAAFVPKHHTIAFSHTRNLFAPIALGTDDDHLYPTFVFRLLTLPMASGPTPREALLARFKPLLAAAARERSDAEAQLFGTGGAYDESLLRTREEMIDQLESAIGALARDLELLERYLARL